MDDFTKRRQERIDDAELQRRKQAIEECDERFYRVAERLALRWEVASPVAETFIANAILTKIQNGVLPRDAAAEVLGNLGRDS